VQGVIFNPAQGGGDLFRREDRDFGTLDPWSRNGVRGVPRNDFERDRSFQPAMPDPMGMVVRYALNHARSHLRYQALAAGLAIVFRPNGTPQHPGMIAVTRFQARASPPRLRGGGRNKSDFRESHAYERPSFRTAGNDNERSDLITGNAECPGKETYVGQTEELVDAVFSSHLLLDAAAAITAVTAAVGTDPAAAALKISQRAVGYQDYPNGDTLQRVRPLPAAEQLQYGRRHDQSPRVLPDLRAAPSGIDALRPISARRIAVRRTPSVRIWRRSRLPANRAAPTRLLLAAAPRPTRKRRTQGPRGGEAPI
jgi:hypothetical protein